MLKYEIASSSEEEGEVHESSFPYYKSYLQYYYYPLTTQFIGKNTVPNIINYKSEGICLKLKKEIKNDYPYISFNVLDAHKPFFDNKFIKIGDVVKTGSDVLKTDNVIKTGSDAIKTDNNKVEFLGVKGDYKEIKRIDRKGGYENRYDRFFQRFLFNKDETPSNYSRIFVLEDRILEAMDCPDAYIFFRVVSTKDVNVVKYIFEDVFYNRMSFYGYLEIYGENILKTHCSEEIRTYLYENTIIFIHSSTVFYNERNGEETPILRRLYSGPDYVKNTMILFNKDSPSFCNIQGKKNENLNIVLKIDLKEGDYVLNRGNIYKIGNEGENVEFKGIEYEDFVKSIWDRLTE